MDHVISFNKFYHERLQEYTDLLGGYETLTASQILQEWCMYLELSVDPCGWQAIWKIPRLTCGKLKIEFPTFALVYVESILYEDLSANILTVMLQDDIDIPKEHCVPLIQLWPTEKQDKSVCLNLMSTANTIDMLRFFYINLFLPWDMEEDCANWFDKHLSSRLRLFYDLRNGTIPSTTADQIKGLLTEARHLETRQNRLLLEIDDDIPDVPESNPIVENLLDARVRMMQIRNEVEMLENPLLRTALLTNKTNLSPKDLSTTTVQYWAIFEEGIVDDVLAFFGQIKNDIGNNDLICQSNLSLTLESARTNDVIFLNSGKHVFSSLCALSEGGVIKGTSSDGNTTLSFINEDVMLDCSGEIVLENINVDVGSAQCGILVRSGSVILKNCTITGNFKSSTHQGIIVLAAGKLIIEKCKISGFYTAIVINSKAKFSINDSTISEVNVGIKFYDDSKIAIRNTKFENCLYGGIYMETDNGNLCEEGDFSILSKISDVENIVGKNIGKYPVKINRKRKLEPICDLLSNPELNPTYIQSTCKEEDDEMEISNSSYKCDTTVIDVNDSN
ncbi:hypothetical protein RI129_003435 [Pyrocoelia pectoralis]|uniref:Right handed beta helix domain-containing protein n=1 Tax=Pyrocoelia pectoralis TaxID=417401 RepID=A0AAN7VQF9_9COLE